MDDFEVDFDDPQLRREVFLLVELSLELVRQCRPTVAGWNSQSERDLDDLESAGLGIAKAWSTQNSIHLELCRTDIVVLLRDLGDGFDNG